MTTLSPIPPFPALSDRAAGTYNSKAYAFGNHMGAVFQPEMAALMPELQSAATASAAAIAAANYKGAWSTLTGPLAIPATVVHNGNLYMLLESVSNVAAEEPGVSSKWKGLSASPLVRVARTSNTQLTAADSGKWIDVTSGTFTQTFSAAAALGDGWWCYLGNSGTGDITLDPSGSETIDGRTTYVMYPGEMRLVQCDGTALRSVVLNAFYKTFTASGTFTKAPGYTAFEGHAIGGGASGARGGGSNVFAGGGGGGACAPFRLPSASIGTTETVTIAAAATGPSVEANGVAGNSSTFGALVTAYGGEASLKLSSAIAGGRGAGLYASGEPRGASTAGVNYDFGGGVSSASFATTGVSVYGGGAGGSGENDAGRSPGGRSYYGAGGGGGAFGGGAGAGGVSAFAGAGGAGGAGATNGTGGTAPGGGGGATSSGTKAGDGARGELRICGVI